MGSYRTCPPHLHNPCLTSSHPPLFHTMDTSEFPLGKPSPRRELQLQGPRPTPLKVRKDSYKIKKSPLSPPHPAAQQPVQPQQHRPPVIIYTVSPKVIHTKPSDFMTLVQRLTGASSSSSFPATSSVSPTASSASPGGGALSPAARLATYEKMQNSDAAEATSTGGLDMILDQIDMGGGTASATLDRSGNYPAGILSPVPTCLPPISPNFFSPPSVDPTASLSFFHHDMSPIFQDNKSYVVENTFLPSPNNFLSTPTLSSPGAYWDLFNQGF